MFGIIIFKFYLKANLGFQETRSSTGGIFIDINLLPYKSSEYDLKLNKITPLCDRTAERWNQLGHRSTHWIVNLHLRSILCVIEPSLPLVSRMISLSYSSFFALSFPQVPPNLPNSIWFLVIHQTQSSNFPFTLCSPALTGCPLTTTHKPISLAPTTNESHYVNPNTEFL